MRITNNMITASTLRNINDAANRLATANDAVSSQQKIQAASDDPVVATRAVTYRSYVSQIQQYQDNVDAADGWQTATDDALGSLSDVLQSVRELTVQASSDTCSDEDLADIQTQITTLRDQAVSIMNSSYSGRYIFGGYSTSEAPYEVVNTTIGDTVTFKGDYLGVGGVVSSDISDSDIESFCAANYTSAYDTSAADENITYNIGFSNDVAVNIEGQDVTGGDAGTNLFDTFSKLLLALGGATSYKSATTDATTGTTTVTTETLDLSSLLDELDTDYDRITTSQAKLGARMNKVDNASDILSDAYTAYSTLMSDNEDVDAATASTEQTTAEYVYQASLSVGAKVVSKSLIDYLG